MSDTEQQLQKNIITLVSSDWEVSVSFGLFREKLAAYISDLINHDFNKLVLLLYRIDISEQKLKTLLASSPGRDTGIIIADMMIEREMRKIQSREQYRQHDKNIPEEDKW